MTDPCVEAVNEAIRKAYIAGATDVHIYWRGLTGTERPEPDFAEAAGDYAADAIAAMHSSRPVVKDGLAEKLRTKFVMFGGKPMFSNKGPVLKASDLADAADRLTTQASELVALKGEIETLRQIVSDCATALGNGSVIHPTSSIEFMGYLPNEIRLHVSSLRSKAKDHSGGGE